MPPFSPSFRMLNRTMDKKVNEDAIQNSQEQFPGESEEGGQRKPPGIISLKDAKALLEDPNLTDQEVEEIKEQIRLMLEIIYEKWLQDQKNRDNQPD